MSSVFTGCSDVLYITGMCAVELSNDEITFCYCDTLVGKFNVVGVRDMVNFEGEELVAWGWLVMIMGSLQDAAGISNDDMLEWYKECAKEAVEIYFRED